jgi:very-short-patch-repair endonuclease
MQRATYERTLASHIEALGLPKPTLEYAFHPTRRWRFDLAWPEIKLAAEIEGGVWVGGRHNTGSGYTEDCIKYNEAVLLGWRVLRFTPDMIQSGRAIEYIEMALEQNGGT